MNFSDDPVTNITIQTVFLGIIGILFILAPTLLVLFTEREFSVFNIVVLFVFACRAIYGEISGRIAIIAHPELYIFVTEGEEETLNEENGNEE